MVLETAKKLALVFALLSPLMTVFFYDPTIMVYMYLYFLIGFTVGSSYSKEKD